MVMAKMQVRFMLLVVAVNVATKSEALVSPDIGIGKAEKAVKMLGSKLTNEEMMSLYGLFKQATVGDVNTDCPSIFDSKSRAKWDAWWNLKGMTKQKAGVAYVDLVERLKEKYKF